MARVRIEDGKLKLMPLAEGILRVTITATDPYGQKATLSFALKVERTMRGRWQGWRRALLRLVQLVHHLLQVAAHQGFE